MKVNTLLPRFTECTFQLLNKAMQKQAANRLRSAGEGRWLCATPGRPWGRQLCAGLGLTSLAHHSQSAPAAKDSTDRESPVGAALASAHPASPHSSLPQNYPWALMGHGQCSPHLITRHWTHSKAWGQSGTPCNAALWCQPLPKHSADPPASNTGTAEGEKLSGVKGASTWGGRPTLSTG